MIPTVCVCVCVFIKLHITAQPGTDILIFLCYSNRSFCVCVVFCIANVDPSLSRRRDAVDKRCTRRLELCECIVFCLMACRRECGEAMSFAGGIRLLRLGLFLRGPADHVKRNRVKKLKTP